MDLNIVDGNPSDAQHTYVIFHKYRTSLKPTLMLSKFETKNFLAHLLNLK